MSEEQTDRLAQLALKGFIPLLMVGAGMYGFYLLFDRLVDAQEKQNDQIMTEILKSLHEIRGLQAQTIQDQIRFRAEIRQFLNITKQPKPAGGIVPKPRNPSVIGGD